jgi:hypothetical protein
VELILQFICPSAASPVADSLTLLSEALIFANKVGQLADKILMVFQRTPLNQQPALEIADLLSMNILDLPVLLGGLPQELDVQEQLGAHDSHITSHLSHPMVQLFRRHLWIKEPTH